MKTSTIIIAIVVLLIIGVGGYFIISGMNNQTQYPDNTAVVTPTPTNTDTITTPAPTGETIKVANSATLGHMLVDGDGKTLYMYMADELNKSNCNGQCAVNWPPVTSTGAALAGDGVTAKILTAITRDDGTTQVAYNGHPLYYWSGDVNAGDATGQNVKGIWFVVSPDGAPIQSNAVLNATSTPLGTILTDRSGRSQYMFTVDTTNTSKCYGDCAQLWPPLLTLGNPVAGPGVNPVLIGTSTRTDGSTQVTYNKLPLYYWSKDTKPGDTTGQNFGKVWFVVAPTGKPIKK